MSRSFLLSCLNNKATSTIFILCSYLLQVQTQPDTTILSAVLADLEKIKTCSKIDASLYTASMTDYSECKASVMGCFMLEMGVIFYESNYESDKEFTSTVQNVLNNIQQLSDEYQDNKTSLCKKCETFEEKKCTEFFETFKYFIQQSYTELKKPPKTHKIVSRKHRMQQKGP